MKYKTINYERTVNLGDYQSERLGIVADLSAKDELQPSIVELKNEVYLGLGLEKLEEKKAEEPKEKVKEKPEKEAEKPEEEVAKQTKKKASKKKTSKKKAATKKKQTTPYDNTNPNHKKLVGSFLKGVLGEGWTADKEKAKAVKQASLSLVGEELIDDNGELCESFTKALIEKIDA